MTRAANSCGEIVDTKGRSLFLKLSFLANQRTWSLAYDWLNLLTSAQTLISLWRPKELEGSIVMVFFRALENLSRTFLQPILARSESEGGKKNWRRPIFWSGEDYHESGRPFCNLVCLNLKAWPANKNSVLNCEFVRDLIAWNSLFLI